MGYLKIPNLYKDKRILEFKWVFALEKIHGSSSHITYNNNNGKPKVHFFSRGAKHENFIALFDYDALWHKFAQLGQLKVTVYGEVYGGKMQGMSSTYGKELKFIVFDVKVGDNWLSVPQAEEVAKHLNLEFVHYDTIKTDILSVDTARAQYSTQADRNGCGQFKKSEGIVLRPPFEVQLNNGERLIAKHKNEDFMETKTPRNLDAEKLEVLTNAQAIAEEWVTEMRLTHILDKLPQPVNIEHMKQILQAMVQDIEIEGKGEIILSKEAKSAISKKTATLFKQRLQNTLKETRDT